MSSASRPAAKIFGTDGIRAIAGRPPLIPGQVEAIGRAAASVLRAQAPSPAGRVLLAKDTRESCDWIEEALACGLGAGGCPIVSCGVLPTSAVAALLQRGGELGGAVVSASHNPSEFNGIKFFSSRGRKIPDAWEERIEALLAAAAGAGVAPAPLPAADFRQGAKESYLDFVRRTLPEPFTFSGHKWVLDCANGAAYQAAPEMFRRLGAELTVLHDRPDGRNINRDCGAVHPRSLQEAVVRLGADGGCAFDGDADRVQFVDEKGRLLDGDVLIAMAAASLKAQGRLEGGCVVTTVMANLGFLEKMKAEGVRVEVTPVGDRSVSEALERTGAVLGGEQSGHIIFRRHLPTGDGILTALQILEILKRSGKKLSAFKDGCPKFPQLLLNLEVKEKVPLESLPELQAAVRAEESAFGGRGRVFVRYSGTEPLLRIMVEGEDLARIQETAARLSAQAGKELRVVSSRMTQL